MIAFTIMGQPCSKANSRQLVTIKGRPAFVKSKDALAYERAALLQIPAEARQQIAVPVRATMRIYYASERPDLDESLILDVLQNRYKRVQGKLERVAPGKYQYGPGERVLVQKGVYVNDRLVREKHIFHFIDRGNPRAEIEIEPLVGQQAEIPLDILPDEEDEDADPF